MSPKVQVDYSTPLTIGATERLCTVAGGGRVVDGRTLVRLRTYCRRCSSNQIYPASPVLAADTTAPAAEWARTSP